MNTEQRRAYRQANLERVRKYNRDSYRRCKSKTDPESLKSYWRRKGKKTRSRMTMEQKAKRDQRAELWRKANPDANRQWVKNNPERIKANYQKRKQHPCHRIRMALTNRLISALRGISKSYRTETLVGCAWTTLVRHIEKGWMPGMNWGNYGRGKGTWCVDHIKPCAAFDLSDVMQQKICFHYSNLRPLWSQDNIRKSSMWNGVRHRYRKTI